MNADPGHLSRAESEVIRRRQRVRNWAMLMVLVALALLFYAIAMVRFKTG
jgi:predicted nucleic acid-binding Zn ribbon protein